MEADLIHWVTSSVGGKIASARRTPTGGSRTTYLVDIKRDGDVLPVVVRVEGEGSFTGTEVTLEREVVAYRALASTPVPVPAVLAAKPDRSAVILERLPGTDDLRSLPEAERAAVLTHFAAVLADLHTVDPDTLDLPGYARPTTAVEHARLDLEMWGRLGNSVEELDPLIEYAGGWLHAHAPTSVSRTCFVQGDTGPGNFLAHRGRVSGLVDMEFAHIGDPADDLAWVLMRTTGLVEPEAFVADYMRRTGLSIEPSSLAFYRLAVDYRCAITTSLAVARGGGARGWAPYLLVTQRYLSAIGTALATLCDVDDPSVDLPVLPPTSRTRMFDRLLEDIRAGVRSIGDDEPREALRNAQIFVHVLRANDRYGAGLEVADEVDRQASGIAAGGRALSEMARRAGSEGNTDALTYLLRRRARGAVVVAVGARPYYG